jgi:threonine dehydratase
MFEAASIEDIQSARRRLGGIALRTPAVECDAAPAGKQLHLKLENLQPIGSFKLRPIGNAVLSRPAPSLAAGIHTASSGNSALAVAWMARRVGTIATAVVPDNAPKNKLELLRKLNARIVKLPFEQWWESIASGSHPGIDGLYIDAVRDPAALAGNGTAGVEILEDLAELDAIFVPFGGGGLAGGIASAVRILRPSVKIIACELETAHPLKSAIRAGHPVAGPYDAGFVTGVGFGSILPESWALAKEMIDGVMTVSLQEVAGAIKIMAERNKVIAEGAGAIPVAAAVVSGGNIDKDVLIKILGHA